MVRCRVFLGSQQHGYDLDLDPGQSSYLEFVHHLSMDGQELVEHTPHMGHSYSAGVGRELAVVDNYLDALLVA